MWNVIMLTVSAEVVASNGYPLSSVLVMTFKFRKSSFKFLAIYDFYDIGHMTSFQLLPGSREISRYVQS